MRQIEISEGAYRVAERAAASFGLSLPEYVEELLAADIDDFVLTPEQLKKIEISRQQFRDGLGIPVDELRRRLSERRANHLEANG